MSNKITQIAQGDVLYTKIKKLPENFNKEFKQIKDVFVVAHGESGNKHIIEVDCPTENLVEISEDSNGRFFLKIKGQAVINHEQHIPAKTLDTGIWFISRQIEYSPTEERLIKD